MYTCRKRFFYSFSLLKYRYEISIVDISTLLKNIDIDMEKLKISISIGQFWKISISIVQFCKILISIKYRIDSNLAYRTGLCPYKLSFAQLWKIPWKCFPLLLWKRACASFVPPPGFLASQPGLDKFLARAARSGCFGEELESSSSCILTVRKWNWMLFKLRQKIRTKGLAVCTMCTQLSHPIQMIHPLHSEQTKYVWCSKKCKMCGHVRRFKRCCLFKLIRRFHKPQKLNVIFSLVHNCNISVFYNDIFSVRFLGGNTHPKKDHRAGLLTIISPP